MKHYRLYINQGVEVKTEQKQIKKFSVQRNIRQIYCKDLQNGEIYTMEEIEIYSQVNIFELYMKVRWILTHYIDMPEEIVGKCISIGNEVLDNVKQKV